MFRRSSTAAIEATMRRLIDALLVAVPAAVLMLIPLLLGAQDIPLDHGDRVRVSGRPTRGIAVTARVIETRADTLVLDDGASTPLVLLAGDLSSIEVERPNRARADAVGAGVALGLVSGTAVAINFCRGEGSDCWFFQNDANDDGDFDDEDDGWLPSFGPLIIGATAFAGGALGALVTPSRWKRLGGYASSPVRIGLRSARRGVGLMVSIPFGGPARAPARAHAAR
jgi:hypothetical protein